MTSCSAYIVPIFALFALLLSDVAFFLVNSSVWTFGTIFLASFYNFLVFMALWSLVSTFYSDPGFVPFTYEYEISNMSKTN